MTDITSLKELAERNLPLGSPLRLQFANLPDMIPDDTFDLMVQSWIQMTESEIER